MPSNPLPTAIPSYRKVLLNEIENSRLILSFDPLDFELKPFFWPVDDKKRVTPDMWLEYRTRHKFQGPHCLCPLLQTTDEDPPVTEAKILLKDSGDHIGEYIAECPNGRCDYFVPLEQKYVLYGVPVKTYAPKGCFTEKQVDMHAENIKEAEQVLTPPSIKQPPSTGNSRPLKRTYAVADLTDPSITIPRATKWTKFNKLDRMKKPGLSEAEFWGLFVKCDNCQRITTREVFRYHLEDCEGCQHEEDTDTSESEQEI